MVIDIVMDASWAYEDEQICFVTCKKSIATGVIMGVHLQDWIRESQEGYKQSVKIRRWKTEWYDQENYQEAMRNFKNKRENFLNKIELFNYSKLNYKT